ncbi:MAG: hotdog fold thioesterase [Proteobacteria bacterium]|nr:hotdog fold thioesterase [Pseudomonadota bacterium]
MKLHGLQSTLARVSIWHTTATPEQLTARTGGSMPGLLGIRFTEVGADFLGATMPVNERTRQPFGLLHGGASLALAETIGSVASLLCIDAQRFMCVGQEINANHLRGVREGIVTATVRPFHRGTRSHVWHIEIRDPQERLVCVSRLTMAIVEKRNGG